MFLVFMQVHIFAVLPQLDGMPLVALLEARKPHFLSKLFAGKKTAERLLLELKDKLGVEMTTAIGVHRAPPVAADVLHALIALGYSDKEAVHAVKQLPDGVAVADGIRQALKVLAKA